MTTTHPVRFGIIGTGAAARTYYAPAFQEVSEAKLIACYDARPERAEDFAKTNGCAAHARFEDMLALPELDAVLVVTQVWQHAAAAMAACRAGKHVLCEKPMAVSLPEADQMIAAAREAGVLLGGIFQMRTSNHFAFLRDLIANGRLGRIQTVDINMRRSFNPRLRIERPDLPGPLVNLLSHDLDFAIGLCGAMAAMDFARVEYWHPELQPPYEDMAIAAWRFASGARGTLNLCCSGQCVASAAQRAMLIIGAKGGARLQNFEIQELALLDEAGKPQPTEIPPVKAPGHAGQLRDFALAVRANRPPLVPGEQQRESLRALLEIMGKKELPH